jgi:hypothetical protein
MIRRGWLKIHPTASLTENDVAFMLRGTVGAKIRAANEWARQGKESKPSPMFRPYQAGITKLEKHFKRHPEEMRFSIETAGADMDDPADVAEAARLWAELGTESPYFKRWFGDSKVVDANGKPLVVYHGTEKDFNEFGKVQRPGMGYGFHFAESTILADHYSWQNGIDYARNPETGNVEEVGAGAKTYPVYLEITNPFVQDVDGDLYKWAEDRLGDRWNWKQATEELIKAGYDGIKYKHDDWGKGMDKQSPYAWAAFSPSQIKSATGNRGTFDAKDADIRMSAAQRAAVFYSQLRNVLNAKLPGRGVASQMKKMLEGWAQKGEFKREELEWSGLLDTLEGMGNQTVTKDQLLDMARAGQIEIKEVTLGDAPKIHHYREWLSKNKIWFGEKDLKVLSNLEDIYGEGFNPQELNDDDYDDFARMMTKYGFTYSASQKDQTKFGQYVLPGGSNYRELLMTMPNRQTLQVALDNLGDQLYAGKITPQEYDRLQKEAKDKISVGQPNYLSGHFSEPNILAHVRFNERTDADGKRVLFIEEIQSDWHQAGREKGYGTPGEVASIKSRIGELQKKEAELRSRSEWSDSLYDEISELQRQLDRAESTVPNAPFKTTWPMLAFKRMIRYAAENGFERIAWTTGEQQADRYDLAKQVQHIAWEKNDDGTYNISAPLPNGNPGISEEDLSLAEVKELVGKDIANKIESGEGRYDEEHNAYRDWYILEGSNLKVGGEGMKGFYDKILPAEVNKYVKKWGAKVGETKIGEELNQAQLEADHAKWMEENLPDFDGTWTDEQTEMADEKWNELTAGASTTVHSLDVTDAMREAAMQGQPMFSKQPPKQRVVSYETASGEVRQAIENVEETPSNALPGQVDMFTGEVVKEPPKPAPKPKQAALAATEDNPLQNDRDTERALKAKADAELADEKARLKSIPAAVDIEAEFFQPEKKQQTLFSKAPANQDEAFGFDLLPESWGQGIRRMVQDQFLRVLTVQKTIEKATGAPLPESSNPYLKEELANALASDKVRRFQDTHIEPLVKAIKASGLTVPEVEDYLLALHAPERNARIAFRNDKFNSPEEKGGAGISNARAAEIRAEIEARIAPEKLDAIRQAVRKIVAFERKTRLDAGLITPKQLDRWIKGDEIAPEDAAVLDEFGLPVPTPWEDYVPLKIDQQGQPARPRVGRGWGVRGKETKAAFGHEAPGEDILGHLLTQSYESVLRAEKNEVGKALLNLVRENPNPAVWEINKTRPVPKENPETGETEWRSVKEIAENTMSVKVDGQEVFITLHDPLLARAFMRLDAPTSNVIVKALGAIGRVWAKLQTQWSPTFAVRNFIRDYVTGNINLFAEKGTAFTGRVAATTPLAVEGIARYMAGNRSKLNPWGRHYEEFQQAGGRIEYLGLRNVETARKELLRAVQETGANPWVITKKVGRSLLQILEGLNTAIENGVRLAAFVEARRRGDSPTQAASLARNLTVNFDRRGEWGVALNSMYVFANANIQGSARMLKALKSPSVWGLLGSWVAFSFALAELNRVAGGDDDDDIPYYDKIEDWEKEKHFIIMRPGTGGKFFKIPLPYGYNIFHVLGTSANAAMHGQDPWQSAASTVVSIMSAFNPLGGERSDDPAKSLVKTLSPTMVDPFVQLGFNENFFGASIMPDKQAFPGQVPKPDSERYFPSATSPVAVSVARKLNELSGGNRVRSGKVDVSPATIEHFYNYFVGGAGRFVSQSYDALNNTTGEPLAPHKIPFKQIFLGQPGEYRISKAYRSNLMEVKTAVDEFKMLAEDDPARARQYLNDNRKLLRLYMTQEQVTSTLRGQEPPRTNSYQQKPAAKDIAKRLSDLDDQLDKAKAAGNIEREKRIRKERNELMTRFNREVNRVTGRNVQKPIPYVTEAAEAVVGVRSGR